MRMKVRMVCVRVPRMFSSVLRAILLRKQRT